MKKLFLEAETSPFFVQRKLILIRDATVMCAGGKEGGKLEHRPEKLIQYMEYPSETSIIVISVNAEKLDERRKLVKTLKERNSLDAVPGAGCGAAEAMDDQTGSRSEKDDVG